MMAAFIVAVQGTVGQAVLLGLSAMISHTAIVWVVALGGQFLGRSLYTPATEPYLQIASAVLIFAVALWMIGRAARERQSAAMDHHQHDHAHGHPHEHDHGYAHIGSGGLALALDAHARAHAQDISRRFQNRYVTTGQIIVFGLTGGLVPCPAAITILLLCLQLKQIGLGALLVGFFSIGLAVTMVSAGAIASLSVSHIRKRWSGFDDFASRAPYGSGVVMALIALHMAASGLIALA
jgi:nickel/cobalt exporter